MFYTARVRQKAQSKDFSTTTAVTVGHDFSHDLRKSKEVAIYRLELADV